MVPSFPTFHKLVLGILLFLFSLPTSWAQQSAGGTPPSFSFYHRKSFTKAIDRVQAPSLDIKKAQAEDAEVPGSVRFAAPVPVNYSLNRQGTWTTLDNGDRIWQLLLSSKGAKGLILSYADFHLPEGAILYVYAPDRRKILGGYTSINNSRSGRFMTGLIDGEELVIEYFEPKEVNGQGRFQIDKLYVAYDPILMKSDDRFQVYGQAGYGDAAACHINANCTQADPFDEQRRSTVRIMRVFEEGIGWCTGTLVNNTAQDLTPYILSAYHCIVGFTPIYDQWRFDFHYQYPACTNGSTEPVPQSVLGCQVRASREQSDFLLFELSANVPASYNAHYAGWNHNDTYVPDSSIIFHHPRGDVKKYSADHTGAAIFNGSIDWNNGVTTPPQHHYRVILDEGTIESGSSGCALMDHNGHIVGQLHGGNADCSQFETFFGRFALSWDSGLSMDTRLREWLDPSNTGQEILDGYSPPVATTALIEGRLFDPQNQGIAQAIVTLEGSGFTQIDTTDINGIYRFEEVPIGGAYTIIPVKDINHDNGLSTFDIVILTKHILGLETMPEAWQLIAGDVNASGTNSTFDVVEMRRLILFLQTEFSNVPSWVFPNGIVVGNLVDDIFGADLFGFKMGDVNGSANPAE